METIYDYNNNSNEEQSSLNGSTASTDIETVSAALSYNRNPLVTYDNITSHMSDYDRQRIVGNVEDQDTLISPGLKAIDDSANIDVEKIPPTHDLSEMNDNSCIQDTSQSKEDSAQAPGNFAEQDETVANTQLDSPPLEYRLSLSTQDNLQLLGKISSEQLRERFAATIQFFSQVNFIDRDYYGVDENEGFLKVFKAGDYFASCDLIVLFSCHLPDLPETTIVCINQTWFNTIKDNLIETGVNEDYVLTAETDQQISLFSCVALRHLIEDKNSSPLEIKYDGHVQDLNSNEQFARATLVKVIGEDDASLLFALMKIVKSVLFSSPKIYRYASAYNSRDSITTGLIEEEKEIVNTKTSSSNKNTTQSEETNDEIAVVPKSVRKDKAKRTRQETERKKIDLKVKDAIANKEPYTRSGTIKPREFFCPPVEFKQRKITTPSKVKVDKKTDKKADKKTDKTNQKTDAASSKSSDFAKSALKTDSSSLPLKKTDPSSTFTGPTVTFKSTIDQNPKLQQKEGFSSINETKSDLTQPTRLQSQNNLKSPGEIALEQRLLRNEAMLLNMQEMLKRLTHPIPAVAATPAFTTKVKREPTTPIFEDEYSWNDDENSMDEKDVNALDPSYLEMLDNTKANSSQQRKRVHFSNHVPLLEEASQSRSKGTSNSKEQNVKKKSRPIRQLDLTEETYFYPPEGIRRNIDMNTNPSRPSAAHTNRARHEQVPNMSTYNPYHHQNRHPLSPIRSVSPPDDYTYNYHRHQLGGPVMMMSPYGPPPYPRPPQQSNNGSSSFPQLLATMAYMQSLGGATNGY